MTLENYCNEPKSLLNVIDHQRNNLLSKTSEHSLVHNNAIHILLKHKLNSTIWVKLKLTALQSVWNCNTLSAKLPYNYSTPAVAPPVLDKVQHHTFADPPISTNRNEPKIQSIDQTEFELPGHLITVIKSTTNRQSHRVNQNSCVITTNVSVTPMKYVYIWSGTVGLRALGKHLTVVWVQMNALRPRLVTSIMIATERRWWSIYKARSCWRFSTFGL